MGEFRPEEGIFDLGDVRIAVIAARWNAEITDGLLAGAVRALGRHDITGNAVEVYRVPGAFELPLAAQQAARTGRFDAIITLGCVIRGETSHYETVCNESARGLMDLSLADGLAIGNGILTVENEGQAWARADAARKDKGGGAARAALAMAALKQEFCG